MPSLFKTMLGAPLRSAFIGLKPEVEEADDLMQKIDGDDGDDPVQ